MSKTSTSNLIRARRAIDFTGPKGCKDPSGDKKNNFRFHICDIKEKQSVLEMFSLIADGFQVNEAKPSWRTEVNSG